MPVWPAGQNNWPWLVEAGGRPELDLALAGRDRGQNLLGSCFPHKWAPAGNHSSSISVAEAAASSTCDESTGARARKRWHRSIRVGRCASRPVAAPTTANTKTASLSPTLPPTAAPRVASSALLITRIAEGFTLKLTRTARGYNRLCSSRTLFCSLLQPIFADTPRRTCHAPWAGSKRLSAQSRSTERLPAAPSARASARLTA